MNSNCLKLFDLNQIKTGTTSLLIGSNGAGKTFLANTFQKSVVKKTVNWCGKIFTKKKNEYQEFVDNFPNIQIETDTEKLESELEALLNIKSKHAREENGFFGALVIIEDTFINTETKFRDSRAIPKLYSMSRHFDVTGIVCIQNPLDISPAFRVNVDYVFLFNVTDSIEKKRTYEKYASFIPSYEIFDQLLTEYTKDHGCLVIDQSIFMGSLLNKIFYYKAAALAV